MGLEFPEETTGAVDDYGFKWGQVVVERLGSILRKPTDPNSDKIIRVKTQYRNLEIYVSPTGRSVRVWRDHKELT